MARLYVLAICFAGAFLFVAVDRLEPNRRFALKPAQASVGALELMGMGIALMLDQRQLSE